MRHSSKEHWSDIAKPLEERQQHSCSWLCARDSTNTGATVRTSRWTGHHQ
jgi:hypothetical protein